MNHPTNSPRRGPPPRRDTRPDHKHHQPQPRHHARHRIRSTHDPQPNDPPVERTPFDTSHLGFAAMTKLLILVLVAVLAGVAAKKVRAI